ncbi:SDR family oxidoreductase [Mesorhizobium sp. NZP2077]|uniref:SDR family oxidoreductase n=1 Tax=Mesorhizobium sp. NZP2077 TaxID=2483404 RepID=UPI0015562D5B|nr:SDR family oxidoreductase [Mesorhizobium sp. NZP2077]QKC85304.1 SDR family oxidoreductase [Mesorhizobium sp. NZP2077]QKD18944.1 SDR family oxidoreductase [Mesorhizobium sp. NZP2077]
MAIAGKIVVITGASSGIGRATAILLAEAGATVVLGARREDVLAEVARDITGMGGTVAYKMTDVRVRGDLEGLVALAVERWGRLDVIVNNAGISPISRFDALQVEDWDAMIDVNLRGTLYGIAAALPVFARQRRGHVVNVVSTAGIKIVPTMGVYAATKNAVRTISETLRQEAGPHLRVTEVSPGMISTNLTDSFTDTAVRDAMAVRIGEIAIPPAAIARGIAFAIDQPDDVDVGSIVIRPTAQD